MKVLVVNCGSSSLKYQLVDMTDESVLCKGLCERIGMEGSIITHKANGKELPVLTPFPTHTEAFMKMVEMMTTGEGAVIADTAEISAIGHRVVHGGEKFSKSVVIDAEVLSVVNDLRDLAPLHNPAGLLGIEGATKVFGDKVPQVAVFDTAFHQTMPDYAYMYGLPYEYYEKYGVRRYGFHGTSHRFVSAECAARLGKKPEELRIITCHLGNGSSIAAVNRGKCMDTTMGFTPLAGLIMGTRSGDMDPSVVTYLADKTGMTGSQLSDLLNKKSGFLGVSGISSDNRDIEKAAAEGNPRAKLVSAMLAYQIKKTIGSYAAAMGGVDAVVFTGGIGENGCAVRSAACEGLEFMGIAIDPEKNSHRGDMDITAQGASVKTLVICTNEELMIARDTMALVR